MFRQEDSTIIVSNSVNLRSVDSFCGAVSELKKTANGDVTIDFSTVTKAYANGMLPIITIVMKLREEGYNVNIVLPNDDHARRLFRTVNWAFFLSPEEHKQSESTHDRHLVATLFRNALEQKKSVDNLMEVVIRNVELSRDIISGLEWSINELTDNVLNHSLSSIGGFVQAVTYHETIAFAVVDGGQGILSSLKEGIPTLRTDAQAIGEAIKAGVTRNPKFGQGNGLAGSLRVTTMTDGLFKIKSGVGYLFATQTETNAFENKKSQNFEGTIIAGELKITKDFSVSKALVCNNSKEEYKPVDMIEILYEMDDQKALRLKMKDETTGLGTRHSGEQIRTKIVNFMNAEPTYPLIIDWEGVPVISSSFADEVIGKLFLRLGAMTFASKLINRNMEPLITALLDKAVSQRLRQANDEE